MSVFERLQPMTLAPLPPQPLVSVLIANYNYARYLGAAIESVLGQTYTNSEIIVCDDGSSDESCAVCETYVRRDARVQLIRKANGGQVSALNAAFLRSRGEIVCLLDSDDAFHPRKLQTIVHHYRADRQTGFISHTVTRVDARGRRRGTLPLLGVPPSGWQAPMLLANGGILPDLPPCSGLTFRREIGKRIFPMPENLGLYGDNPVMRLAPLMTKILGLETPLAEWRQHGGNAFNKGRLGIAQLDRSLQMYAALWELQRAYLARVDSDLAAAFCPLDQDQHILTLHYLRARLSGDGTARLRHHLLTQSTTLRRQPRIRQWFWRTSIWLPRPIFRASVSLLVSQNVLKHAVALVRRLRGPQRAIVPPGFSAGVPNK